MTERHTGACDFERRFPQGLLCDIDDVPEGWGIVYLVTNLINDKVYVGQTWAGIGERWKQHQYQAASGNDVYFHNALRKHGVKNFSVGLLGKAKTEKEVHNLERLWIALLGATKPEAGYNLTWGGEGVRCTEETRKKIAETLATPEVKQKLSLHNLSRWENEEYRRHMGGLSAARWEDSEYRERHTKVIHETWSNPSIRQRVSEKMEQNWTTPEYRERALGSPAKIAANTKHSKTMRDLWNDPVYKEKQSRSRREVQARKREEKDGQLSGVVVV